MILTNSFRFGEVSRKQAGRFAEEGYQQGSFQFKNVRTMFDTGLSRRFPLRTEVSIPATDGEIYTIHGFDIGEKSSFLIAIGAKYVDGVWQNNIIKVYPVVKTDGKMHLSEDTAYSITTSTLGSETEISILGSSSQSFVFATATETAGTHDLTLSEVQLTKEICRGIRFAQYYDRLYIVSHSFRTIYLQLTGTVLSANIAKFVFNQDAKSKVWYVPSGSTNLGADTGKNKGTVLFKVGNKFYTDIERTQEYVSVTGAPDPVQASSSYVSGFQDYEEDYSLNHDAGTFPSVVAVIGYALYFGNTERKPSMIWKSRDIGSSQWIADYKADGMHDFSQFEVVSTREDAIKDQSEWEVTESGYNYTENGIEVFFTADKSNDKYTYATKLTRVPQYWIQRSDDYLFYTEADDPADSSKKILTQYTWTSKAGEPVKHSETINGEPDPLAGKWTKPDGTELIYRTATEAPGSTPFVLASTDSRYYHATDYIWYKEDGTEYSVTGITDPALYPIKKPMMQYDIDPDKLIETVSSIDFVTTDSCGVRMELNTGLSDAIRFISSGCEKIIVGTSTSEWTLPANFNAVTNLQASNYASYGALNCEPIRMNRSFFFLQRGRILREVYMQQSYMMTADVTALNHDLISEDVVDTVSKNAPDPIIYLCLENGHIVQIMYDRDGGLNSMAEWYSGDGNTEPLKFQSLASVMYEGNITVMALVKDTDGSTHICRFDEETDEYEDVVGTNTYQYESIVETVYAEANNQEIVFGKFKKARGMHLRPYECGHIYVGNDKRQLTKSNYSLESDDYYFPITGKSNKQFSMFIKSCGNEPMNILAMAWEIDNGS